MDNIALPQILKGEFSDDFIRFFIGAGWCVVGLLAVSFFLFHSEKMAIGIIIGGVISGFNSIGLEKDCRRMVRWQSMAAYFAGLSVRMALITLGVSIAFLFLREYFSPVGLFIGLSAGVIIFYILVIGMIAYKLRMKEA